MSKKEAVGIVAGAFVVLVIVITILVLNKPHLKVEQAKSTEITAAELSSAYQKDESRANEHYLNKALEVSGKVSGVERNQDGGSMVLLESGSPDAPVQCTMRDSGAPLPAGTRVKLKGFCTGSNLSGVTLTDCIVAVN